MILDLSTMTTATLRRSATFTTDDCPGSDIVYFKALPQALIFQHQTCRSLLVSNRCQLYLTSTAEDTLFQNLQRRTEHYYFSQAQAANLHLSKNAPLCYKALIYIRFHERARRSWLALHEVADWHGTTADSVTCKLLNGMQLTVPEKASAFKHQANMAVQLTQYRHALVTEILGFDPALFVRPRYADSWIWRHAHDNPTPGQFPNFQEHTQLCMEYLIKQVFDNMQCLKDSDLDAKAKKQCYHRLINYFQRE